MFREEESMGFTTGKSSKLSGKIYHMLFSQKNPLGRIESGFLSGKKLLFLQQFHIKVTAMQKEQVKKFKIYVYTGYPVRPQAKMVQAACQFLKESLHMNFQYTTTATDLQGYKKRDELLAKRNQGISKDLNGQKLQKEKQNAGKLALQEFNQIKDDYYKALRDQIVQKLGETQNNDVIVVLESNRLGGSQGLINPFGQAVKKKYKGRQINGKRIILFDGQEVRHHYNSTAGGWPEFNQIFKNYWYLNRNQSQFIKNEISNMSRLLPGAVIAILSYVLQPIQQLVPKMYLILKDPYEKEVIETLKMFYDGRLTNSQEKKLQLLIDTLTKNIEIDKVYSEGNETHLKLITAIVQKTLTQTIYPLQCICFIDDRIKYERQIKTSNQQVVNILKYQQATQNNNWLQFAKKAQNLNGVSMGIINPKIFDSKNKIIPQVSHISNVNYVKGFNAGELINILHMRYIYQFYLKFPLVLSYTVSSPQKQHQTNPSSPSKLK